ncbi:MAG: glycogen synthase GlgA [Candidatus Omnitrophota bacterium]
MKIAFCTSEAVPFAKTGGLADVCGALPLALEDCGQEVIVIMPKYQSVRFSSIAAKTLDDDCDWAVLGKGVKVYFVKHDMFSREGLYGDQFGDYPDNLKRFSYFCAKALEIFQKIKFIPDVIHCHDWQTSLVPVMLTANAGLLKWPGQVPKTLLTIHNISYQGMFAREQMPQTGLDWKYFSISGLEFFGQINLLKGGILYADALNTVSLTHSQEIQTQAFGCGLDGVLRTRSDRFTGIVNGVDYKIWNPQGDAHLFKPYSVNNIEDKKVNKKKLQDLCGLAQIEKLPLLGFVGRLVEQKGIDLIAKALPTLCQHGIQTVVLGVGEKKYEEALTGLARQYPSLVFYSPHFDDELAHHIYAGSDVFLMPSQFEPCGIGQLISFKYGTVPVVYKTGGLADTVLDVQADAPKGSGFVFAKYTDKGFLSAIERARRLFAEPAEWQELVHNIMRLNFSWKESAKKYIDLYEKAKKG